MSGSSKNEVITVRQGFDNLIEALEGSNISEAFYPEYQDDPVGFCTNVLGANLWYKQKEILEAIRQNSRVSVRSCHSTGKSYLAACSVLWFLHCFRPSTVITTAPTGRQVKEILWPEITTLYNQAIKPLGGRLLTTKLNMSETEKWFGIGFSTDEHSLEHFQGFHNRFIYVLLDEASGIEAPIHEAIEGVLSSGELVRLLQISNPTDEATIYGDSFKNPVYTCFALDAYDSPNFVEFGITEEDIISGEWKNKVGDKPYPRPYLCRPDWVENLALNPSIGIDSPVYEVRVRGMFPTISTDTLIPLRWFELAQERELKVDPEGEKHLGLDVGEFGDDESVLSFRIGDNLIWQQSWVKQDPVYSGKCVADAIEAEGVPPKNVKIDRIGVGSGTVAYLKEIGYSEVQGIHVNQRAYDTENYTNIRAEMFWQLRTRFRSGNIDIPNGPDYEQLKKEATKFKYEYISGKLKLEPKKDTKQRLGKSPDRSDSLALCFYEPEVSGFSEIGSIQEMLSCKEVEKSSEILYNENIGKHIENILSIKPNQGEVCPHCNTGVGLAYSSQHNCSQEEATKRHCIICGTYWVRDIPGEQWKEVDKNGKEVLDGESYRHRRWPNL